MACITTAVGRLLHLNPSSKSNPNLLFSTTKPLVTFFTIKSSSSNSPIVSSSSSNSPIVSSSSSSNSSIVSSSSSSNSSIVSSSSSSSSRSTTLSAADSLNSSIAMSYDKQLVAAKKAASLAARLCQNVQKGLLQSDVQSKSDKSPVTVADYGSQVVVSFVLQKELPNETFSLVAEEDSGDLRKEGSEETLERITKLVSDTITNDGTYNVSPLSKDEVLKIIDCGTSEGGSNGQHWVLDPIDGTKGFLRGDQYAIALGLLDEGKVVLGVLACPNLPLESIQHQNATVKKGCLFSAQLSCGTYMESLDGSPPLKVHVSNTENPEEASFFESYEAAHSSHSLSGSIAKKLGVKAPAVRIDSQAKYGALSRGDGAIYLRFPNKGYREKIWDHAAGYIVVAEVGGVATDASGNPLDFSKGRYLDLDTGIIVTNQKLMPALLKAVQDSLKEQQALPSL